MKCDVWKPCSDQRWQDELRFSIWRFFEQSSFVNIHLLCYWPTIHNSISKICPKFQVISSHFFEVDELLNEHWAKIVWSEIFSTPIYIKCNKMYRSKVCVQLFSYFVSGLDIQLEKSEYNSPICKKISFRWQNMKSHITFFLEQSIWNNGSVVKTGCRVWLHGYDSLWVLKPSAASRPFCVALGLQCTDTSAFYHSIAALFFFLDFVSGNLALTEL